jgi:Zn-dependent M28 family amino/carboxypeptidase
LSVTRRVPAGSLLPLILATLAASAVAAEPSPHAAAATPEPTFRPEAFAAHAKTLASDEFGGRRPATDGETKTVAYIEGQFRALGLRPGAGGSYRQAVPFVELATQPAATLDIAGRGGALKLKYADEAVYWTKRVVPQVSLAGSDLVFVGYGIVEPAQNWNDYAGIDMHGKTAVILVNDPGFATGDPALFNGRAMTYHGRWTYKFEEAARQGAAGAIIVHEEAPAAYPWEVVRNGAARPQLVIQSADDNVSRVGIEGWMTRESAVRVFAAAGLDYDTAKASAARRGFKPLPLPLKATTEVQNQIRRIESSNVIGVVDGAARPNEYVLYSAHWDHLGTAATGSGDRIYNGAADNATGVAGLLELARAFAAVRPRPERSIVFVAFTGEEYGLLGSEYFAAHPPMPVTQIAGGVNMDVLSTNGRTHDVTVQGLGSSELEDDLKVFATRQGRVLEPDPTPEKGAYYRSDHFMLARRGVPMLYAKSGVDSIAHGREWGLAQDADYVANRYHKPSDEYDPNWDLGGAMEDLQLYFDVGLKVARETSFPNWYPGNEFRAIRDKSRAEATAR